MGTKILFILGLAILLWLSACGRTAPSAPSQGTQTLNVFAAASLTEAFTEIGKQFETGHPGVKVIFNFAGSQQLAQQLNDGAPAGVFASANQVQMDAVIQMGRIMADDVQSFASNRLVVIYPQDNPAGLDELQDLSTPGLRLVIATREVPVGQYTLDFLDKTVKDTGFGAAFKEHVLDNVVSYENDVKAVLVKAILGEADAGIVYASDLSVENISKVGQIQIPDALNVIAAYPIATLVDSANPELADAFVAGVLSPEGQAILSRYGFVPVKK